jgi:predicted PurR-regulated permease PerM
VSGPIGASAHDVVGSPPTHQVTTGGELASLVDDQIVSLGVDDAVAALDRAVQEEAADVGGPDTPARRAMLARRRARLRELRSSVSLRLNAERAIRAAERDALLASAQPAPSTRGESRRALRDRSPFAIGFAGGLGLILAYAVYLSLDGIRSTLVVMAIAALLAIGLDPSVGWLMRRGLRRGWAVALIFLALLTIIGGALYAIVPPIVGEVASFVTTVPDLIANLQTNPTIKNLDVKFHLLSALESSSFVQTVSSGAAGGILSVGLTVAGIAADALVVLVLTVFFLAAYPQVKVAAYRLAPASRRPRVQELGDRILKQMGGYLAGATIVAAQAGVVAGLFAAVVGLPFPWAIALGAALMDFVPVIGPVIVGVSMALLGFTQSLTVGLVAAAFYICQHLFEAYWFHPRVMRRQVDISTGAVVVAIVVGGALLGIVGAVLAVPVAAAVQLIVREVVVPHQERI